MKILTGFLFISCICLFIQNRFLNNEIDNLKLKNFHFQNEIKTSKEKLLKQNQAILDLKIKIDNKQPLKEVLKVKEVFIKDDTCQSELKAYKELFNILGAKQ